MAKTSFRQSDLERIFRAAKSIDATVQIDLKTLVLTVRPPGEAAIVVDPLTGFRPDGKEDWSDIDVHAANEKPASWDFDL
jgi:hypothetical protein